jgi:hypothetical protein
LRILVRFGNPYRHRPADEVRGSGEVDNAVPGDAPEGVLFISAEESPNGKPLLIVSSEEDGFLRVYQND